MNRRMLCIFLCCAMLLSLWGCTSGERKTETAATERGTAATQTATTEASEETDPQAYEWFEKEYNAVADANRVKTVLTLKESRWVSATLFTQEIERTVLYEGLQQELTAQVNESILWNEGEALEVQREFRQGRQYSCLSDEYMEQTYAENFSEEQFLESFPVFLFDPKDYGIGDIQENYRGTVLTFTDTEKIESWVGAEDAILTSAEGTVSLGEEGIKRMGYTVEYSQGPADVKLTVSCEYEWDPEESETKKPLIKEADYCETESVENVLKLHRAFANYYWAPMMHYRVTQTTDSEALARSVTQQREVWWFFDGSGHGLAKEERIYRENGAEHTVFAIETLEGEKAARIESGADSYSPADLSFEENFRRYGGYMDYVWYSLYAPEDFIQLRSVGKGGDLVLEVSNISQENLRMGLFLAARVFDEDWDGRMKVDEYNQWEVKDYRICVTVDPYTCNFSAYTMDISAEIKIGGQQYDCHQQMGIYIHPMDLNAIEIVSGESLYEEEVTPEQRATPLLYHVTGEEGQELWLLGTIHIGDARTGDLPKELYEAFDASDALAVEVDVYKHENDLAMDEDYRNRFHALYFYEDGSTAKEHLEPQLYERAKTYLMEAGLYDPSLEQQKVGVWNQILDDHLLERTQRLPKHKGVDRRLCRRAMEQGKEILSIEEIEPHYSVTFEFSDPLQAYLLEENLEATLTELLQSYYYNYEMWCRGDEEELLEYYKTYDTGLSSEEQILMDEFKDGLQTQRDRIMHDRAVEYLESGDTVFFAVGNAHVMGEKGLLYSLRQAGYEVEAVKYAT